MIYMFTDFGIAGPYLGQMHARLLRDAPAVPVVNLMADAPAFDPIRSAYLLAAYTCGLAAGDVVLGVVDPGVGSAREGVVLRAGGVWYVGPDNGLFEIVAGHHPHDARWWRLPRAEEGMSSTFHGRDWFAPKAAALATDRWSPPGEGSDHPPSGGLGLSEDLCEVVYIDDFGNALTGINGAGLACGSILQAGGRLLSWAETYSDVPQGQVFWYVNSNGLVELAANRARACDVLGVGIGAQVVRTG